ncbi:MAG: 3-hydroxyanthranilate 3,4-dioxygenase [Myxococcota bacterium]|jgi:3-hydroxyanthranilate 3,4-dioxygenase|nr:3-hydroxyanthranilate 3,4-dioxygenase [Myxococcota bacterium]MEC9440394.1 3-hydroxyanthranilate 3,4-dioxygenase [Myxococcota bacterium]
MKMPINLHRWVDENRDLLKPPVGNKKIYEDQDFMIFVVGGPNARKDYHIDPSEEFFYQIEGDITLKIVEDGEFKDVTIREGEIFLLPSYIPHSPQRPADTIGLVIEHKRPEGADDGLRWYCEGCGEILHDATFPLVDIVGQLREAIQTFMNSEELRTCKHCGAVMQFD